MVISIIVCDQCKEDLSKNSWEIKQKDICKECHKNIDKNILNLCEKCGNKMFNNLKAIS